MHLWKTAQGSSCPRVLVKDQLSCVFPNLRHQQGNSESDPQFGLSLTLWSGNWPSLGQSTDFN